jgi:hypothetical protein
MSSMTWQSNILCACVFFCLALPFGQVFADDEWSGTVPPTKDQAMQRVRGELENLERRWYAIGRVRYTYPQEISVGFGAMLVDQPKDTDCSTSCMVQGWQFEIEPGLFGTQGSVGWGKLVGETGRTRHLMYDVHLGWAVRGVVMRTYRDYRFRPLPKTLAGIEGSFTFARLNFTVGVLHSLSSGDYQDWLISSGVGFGF